MTNNLPSSFTSYGKLHVSSELLMDFLKSAVASAISKGPPFPYNFGEVVPVDDDSIWTLYNGVKRVSMYWH